MSMNFISGFHCDDKPENLLVRGGESLAGGGSSKWKCAHIRWMTRTVLCPAWLEVLHLIHNIDYISSTIYCGLHPIHNIGYISSTLGSYHPIHIGFIIQTIVYISSTQFSSHPQYMWTTSHLQYRLHLIHTSTVYTSHSHLNSWALAASLKFKDAYSCLL